MFASSWQQKSAACQVRLEICNCLFPWQPKLWWKKLWKQHIIFGWHTDSLSLKTREVLKSAAETDKCMYVDEEEENF